MSRIRIERKSTQGGSVRVTLLDPDPVDSWEGRFGGDRALIPLAKDLGVQKHWLREKLDQGDGEYELPGETVASEPAVYVRGINQPAEMQHEYATFAEALRVSDYPGPEPLISWFNTDQLCCVDADFHVFDYAQRPSEIYLSGRLGAINPAPRFCWVTHGRGLRLVYLAQGIYLASELASVATVRLMQLEPRATVELKSSTRHPGYPNAIGRRCSEVVERVQNTDCSAVMGWYEGREGVDEDSVREWLEGMQFTIGGRYEHDRCPVDSGTPSHGTPVVVYENGVYCYGCAGHGVRRGTKSPGWFPFEVFVGSPAPSAVERSVENFTHWEHARFVLRAHFDLPEAIVRGAYGALLKSKHGIDPRIQAVFTAGRDLVRYSKRWGTLEGESFTATHSEPIIAKLPACQYLDGKQAKKDPERVARLLQPLNSERYGYPHLRPVWGLPIYSHWLTPRYPYEITIAKGPGAPPRYIPRAQRGNVDQAWGTIRNSFPGVSRQAIELLVAAKGCAEADGTFPPFIFITGATGSAKTTSIILAASIAGDTVHSVPSISDDQRIRAAIIEAAQSGTYCVFDEAVKDGTRRGLGKAELMEFALSLTPNSVSHKLYTGPVPMGAIPVLVWTDTYLPQEIKQHAQLARRFVHIQLDGTVDWHTSMRDSGMGKAEWLRCGGNNYVVASDTIISDIIDRFFSAPHTIAEIAKELGFHTLAESEEAQDQNAELLRFFTATTALSPSGYGTVVLDLNDNSEVVKLWRELSDPGHRSSQRCSEVDWSRLLGTPDPIRFIVNARGTKVRIRFEGVTDELLCRLRNPISNGPHNHRGAEVHSGPLNSAHDVGNETEWVNLAMAAADHPEPPTVVD